MFPAVVSGAPAPSLGAGAPLALRRKQALQGQHHFPGVSQGEPPAEGSLLFWPSGRRFLTIQNLLWGSPSRPLCGRKAIALCCPLCPPLSVDAFPLCPLQSPLAPRDRDAEGAGRSRGPGPSSSQPPCHLLPESDEALADLRDRPVATGGGIWGHHSFPVMGDTPCR